MKKGFGVGLMAAVLAVGLILPMTLSAAGPKGGNMGGQALQTQTRTMDQIRTQDRLRDGSCTTGTATPSGAANKMGKTYGPGDGTGNMGTGPRNGTGYGAPANR